MAKLGEENDSSCCCVVGIESVSGITVGSGSGCVSGIMCGSSVGFSDIFLFCIVGFSSLVVGWSLLVIGSCAGSFLDMWVIVFVIFRWLIFHCIFGIVYVVSWFSICNIVIYFMFLCSM